MALFNCQKHGPIAWPKTVHFHLGEKPTYSSRKICEAGVQFAKYMDIHEFIREGDSLIISNSLAERSPTPILVTLILYDIVSSLHMV